MLQLIGFDGDDTLWHSEGYYREANDAFAAIMARYVDLGDQQVADAMLATEQRNLQVFGYGAKGMALSMVETAIAISDQRISASDIHRLVELGKSVLQHPVELLPGIREAVEAVAANYPVVLITKGDLFHQESKIERSGLADLFRRIEVVSEKDATTYARVLRELDVAASRFVMIGNSLRSDIEPVVALGGWGIHMPYHITWAHEAEHALAEGEPRMLQVTSAHELHGAIQHVASLAAAA